MAFQAETQPKRRQGQNRLWLVAGIVLTILVVIPAVAISVFAALFNPNAYAPAITQAVSRATGRQLTLGSPISLQLSLTPTLTASNISLSNPPGFADANFAAIGQVEARFALLPLLRHRLDIISLNLENPAITLERGPSNAADWDFSAAPQAPGQPAAPRHAARHGWQVALESVEIDNGSLIIKSPDAPPTIIQLTTLTGQANAPSAPLNLTAQAAIGQTPFSLTGTTGPVARFTGAGSGPWPVNLNLSAAGASASVTGSIAEPRAAKGYDLSVNLSIPALEALNTALPAAARGGITLPPIHTITASAEIQDQSAAFPAINKFKLAAGASDLSSLWPGLSLASLNVQGASLASSLTIAATGQIGNGPASLQGTLGAPGALLNPAWLPPGLAQGSLPVSLTAQLGNAQLSATGTFAAPQTLSGASLAITASIPDLSALSAAAATPLPAWKNIAAKATLIDPGGNGLLNAVELDGIAVTMDNAAFGGTASLTYEPRQWQAALDFSQANLDNLLAAWPQPQPQPQAAPTAPPAAAAPDDRLIPATPLPLNLIKSGNADIQLSADSLVWKQITYTAVQAHARLANNVLTIAPLNGELPGGSISASLSVDATKDPAAETLQASAPALALAPLLHVFNLPDDAQGTVQAKLSASSTGDDLAAIEAGLNGQFGAAGVNGTISGALLGQILGNALQSAGLPPDLAGAQGPVSVRCAALRIDATNGIGTIRALTLDSSRLLLQGSGTVNFGQESYGVTLNPQAQIGGSAVAIPVKLGGSFTAPSFTPAPNAQTAAGLAAGVAAHNGGLLGALGSLFGGGGQSTPAPTDTCPAALALARMGQPGPAAPPPGTPGTSQPTPAQPSLAPKNLLNTLLGQ